MKHWFNIMIQRDTVSTLQKTEDVVLIIDQFKFSSVESVKEFIRVNLISERFFGNNIYLCKRAEVSINYSYGEKYDMFNSEFVFMTGIEDISIYHYNVDKLITDQGSLYIEGIKRMSMDNEFLEILQNMEHMMNYGLEYAY